MDWMTLDIVIHGYVYSFRYLYFISTICTSKLIRGHNLEILLPFITFLLW